METAGQTSHVAVPHCELPAPPGRALLLGLCALAAGWGITAGLHHRGAFSLTGIVAVPGHVISSPVDGRLVRLSAGPRDVVQSGAPLAVIDDRGLSAGIESGRQLVARLQDELSEAAARADVDLVWRQKDLQAEIHRTQLQSADLLKEKLSRDIEQLAWSEYGHETAAPVRLAAAEDIFTMLNSQEGRSEERQLRAALKEAAARNAAEVLDAQIELCDQRLAELRQLARQLPEKLRQAGGLAGAHSRLEQAEEKLALLEMQPRQVTVCAPAYGVVGVFRRVVGSDVARGEVLVELLDFDRPHLMVKVSSAQLPHVSQGTEVALLFPGNVERAGRVCEIPPQTAAIGDSSVAIRIEQSGKLWPRVPVGSAVEIIVTEMK